MGFAWLAGFISLFSGQKENGYGLEVGENHTRVARRLLLLLQNGVLRWHREGSLIRVAVRVIAARP
jgi:hypothetical protein